MWSLTIIDVRNTTNSLAWSVVEANPAIGQVLVVDLGSTSAAVGDEVKVEIAYATQPQGQAFSWLTASQTAGKKLPYMFTQCEDINCRSVAPL